MVELLFGHVSVPAWGTLMLVSVPAWGAECLDVLRPKAVAWES